VVADIANLSVGWEEDYTRELATDHEAYLSGRGESPGRSYGAGATALGLQGEASPAGFQAMLEGRDPMTGELLGRPHAAADQGRLAAGGVTEAAALTLFRMSMATCSSAGIRGLAIVPETGCTIGQPGPAYDPGAWDAPGVVARVGVDAVAVTPTSG
jgi:hypothetical protein